MTVTLAYRDPDGNGAYMIGDSCASDSYSHSAVKNHKVFHPVGRRDILFGCAGTFRLPNLLQFVPGVFPPEEELATDDIDLSYLINEFTPVVRALIDDFDKDDPWEVLIAVGNRIYRMQMDLSIIEPAGDCDAIGCGGPVALGAFKVLNELEPNMPVEERMSHALRVACDLIQGCAPPFTIRKVEDSVVSVKPGKQRKHTGYEIIRSNTDNDADPDDSDTDSEKLNKDHIKCKHKKCKKK